MKKIFTSSIIILLAFSILPPLYGLGKKDTILVGNIEWYQYKDTDYGLRLFLPTGIALKEVEEGEFGALIGETEDGIQFIIQGTPQNFSLDELEEFAVEDLELDPNKFELVDKEKKFHNLSYRWYSSISEDGSKVLWIMVANNTQRPSSYVFYIGVPGDIVENYQDAFVFWFTNIYGLKKDKNK